MPVMASPKPAIRTTVTSHYEDPGYGGPTGIGPSPSSCDPFKPGVCAAETHGHATFTGGMVGKTDYRAQGRVDLVAGLLYQEVWQTLYGSVAGCGTGSIRWYVHGTTRLRDIDPLTQTGPQKLAVDIISGSGTGGLTGLTGTAATDGTLKPYPGENHGTFKGRFTCRPARRR